MRAKGNLTTTVGPPPSYQEPKSKTKLYLIAIVTVTVATLLVVSVGVFYLMINGKSPSVVNNVTANDGEPVVIVRDISFEMSDGVPRNEKMMAEGNTLTIENRHDGYTVVFDFDRNLALFKNRTTLSCFFTRLDDLPVDMNKDNLTANLPVYFSDASTPFDKLLNQSIATMSSSQFEAIPTGYLELTSTEECASGSSFWIEPMGAQRTRSKRSDEEVYIIVTDCRCYIIIIVVRRE